MNKQPSGILRRLGAILYDSLLILALLFLATIPFIAYNDGESVETGNPVFQLWIVFVVYVFFVGFWSTKGRTLGMQSWGLQLETPEGERVGLAAASIRYFAAILSWAPVGIGFLWQLVDPDKLTWHDRLSNTRLMHYAKDKTPTKA
ncbi:MAG: RDD family protein [Pseudomonadota bacterium]